MSPVTAPHYHHYRCQAGLDFTLAIMSRVMESVTTTVKKVDEGHGTVVSTVLQVGPCYDNNELPQPPLSAGSPTAQLPLL